MKQIRLVTPDDLDFIIATAIRFNDKHFAVPLNVYKATAFFEDIITEPAFIGFRSDNGCIIGAIEQDPLRDWTLLREYGWFAEDRSGIALLREFQEFGLSLPVDEIRMTTLASNPRVTRLLRKYGYTELETSHSLKA